MMINEPVWKDVCILGQGSFGVVRLFANQQTGEQIALKEMKVDLLQDLDHTEREKTKMRLINEVKIMWEHDHDNLVRALCFPQKMHYKPPDNCIHVWMEYCDGGDIRKETLRVAHNCCGTSEKKLRRICTDVNSGIKFLHQRNIIHRDLKPENILMKKEPGGKVVYKLTDFGYAKTYSLSSRAESMVGTPQYVAPEIIDNGTHGSTVDFWSFGVIAFELATGIRPFLHKAKRLFEWIGPTSNKSDDCIHIYFPLSGQPVESNQIPQPNQLSSTFAEEFTQWLRLALHYKPEKRGGVYDHTSSEDAQCLKLMDKVLETKVLNIVCMSTGDVLSLKIVGNGSFSSLRHWLRSQGFNKSETIFFVTNSNQIILPDDENEDLVSLLEWDENIATVYMYTTSLQPSFKLVQQVLPTVTSLLATGDERIHKDDKQGVFSHVFFHLREHWRLFDRVHTGHSAMLEFIQPMERRLKEFSKDRQLVNRCYKLLGLAEHVKKMHSEDYRRLENYQQQERLAHIKSDQLSRYLTAWHNNLSGLDKQIQVLENSSLDVLRLCEDVERTLTTTEVMTQRHINSFEHFEKFRLEYVEKALNIYKKERNGDSNHPKMSDLLQFATHNAENIIQDHLNGVDYLDLYINLSNLLQRFTGLINKLDTVEKECDKISNSIQADLWILIAYPQTGDSISRQGSQVSVQNSMNMLPRIDSAVSTTSDTSYRKVIERLKSQTSISSESYDGESSDVDSLLGSLRAHINDLKKTGEKEMDRNRDMISRLDSQPLFKVVEEEDDTPMNSHQEATQ